MALIDLWRQNADEIAEKHIEQILKFAGDGRLRDGEDTSQELREYLAQIPSSYLSKYANECLTTAVKFDDSGLALQDIVNEVGRRLGFRVTNGRYRGSSKVPSFDGVWGADDDRSIVVEVKTTDLYGIKLEVVESYRKSLVAQQKIDEPKSSILLVVGREDTGSLEAQIRGSRHAWNIRLISVDGLLRLLNLKEHLDDPITVRKIVGILTPQEFTRVDSIIDLVFSTAEDVRQGDEPTDEQSEAEDTHPKVSFNEACVARIQRHLGCALITETRTTYRSPDGNTQLVCLVSKEYQPKPGVVRYWYGFHRHQQELLAQSPNSFFAIGCGSEKKIVLFRASELFPLLKGLRTTESKGRFYWHLDISQESDSLLLNPRKGFKRADISKYLLPQE